MEGVFGTAFMLLVVGMITVFSVLLMVVILGKMLIRLVNSLHKEVPVSTKPIESHSHESHLTPNKLAVLVSAVDIATSGKGHIKSIEKID